MCRKAPTCQLELQITIIIWVYLSLPCLNSFPLHNRIIAFKLSTRHTKPFIILFTHSYLHFVLLWNANIYSSQTCQGHFSLCNILQLFPLLLQTHIPHHTTSFVWWVPTMLSSNINSSGQDSEAFLEGVIHTHKHPYNRTTL